MKNNTIVKYNCYKCDKEVEIQTTMDKKRILKICTNCWLKHIEKQSNEYIPFVEKENG